MRTIGFVAVVAIVAAYYAAPDMVEQLVVDAAKLARSNPPESAIGPEHRANDRFRPVKEAVTTQPWETVAEVIADAALVKVNSATLRTEDNTTVFTLGLTQGLTAEVFTLAKPYRVVIDMPEVAFQLPDGTGKNGRGLVETFRYGLFSADRGRVVLDTKGPVRIAQARMVATASGMDFEVQLAPISASDFGDGTGANRKPTVTEAKPNTKTNDEDQLARLIQRETNRSRPVIVIDPGHGGIDPGAVGVSNVLEKDVVLAVGLALRDALKKSGKFEVHMTRARDMFLSLTQRVEISEAYDADLFVSLHADSVADETAKSVVRGASVYTLSNKASDDLARKMAEKENSADSLAGLETDQGDTGTDVRTILIDLMQRETANFSTDFSNVLLRQLRRDVSLTRGPKRSAAFRVLKQSHAPSVLIELGYMSHPGDERMMRTKTWRAKIAKSIAKAIQQYFQKRQARR